MHLFNTISFGKEPPLCSLMSRIKGIRETLLHLKLKKEELLARMPCLQPSAPPACKASKADGLRRPRRQPPRPRARHRPGGGGQPPPGQPPPRARCGSRAGRRAPAPLSPPRRSPYVEAAALVLDGPDPPEERLQPPLRVAARQPAGDSTSAAAAARPRRAPAAA